MNYKNASNILPDSLIQEIQQYVQGEYIYIPIKDKAANSVPTEYIIELKKRNEHIFTKYLEGVSNRELANMYHLSESSIRRIIVEQRKDYKAMYSRIQQVINEWNIEKSDIKQIYDSAWQLGGEAVLKVYDDCDMLQRNIKMLTILEQMEIPVGKIIRAKNEKTYVKDDKYFYILSEKLQGSNLTDIHKNSIITSEMGLILAKLHIAFKECEKQEEFWNNSLLQEMKGWIKDVFTKNGWKYIDEDRFISTVEKLECLYEKLPVQLIHRDVHLGNFLFYNDKFSGYIDFDLSQRNVKIFDLCYFVLGLLSEEELLDISEEQWFDILKYFFGGYEQEIQLVEEEKKAVPYVMESIELLFAAWFLEQNDIKCAENAIKIYEFVEKNEERVLKTINA